MSRFNVMISCWKLLFESFIFLSVDVQHVSLDALSIYNIYTVEILVNELLEVKRLLLNERNNLDMHEIKQHICIYD